MSNVFDELNNLQLKTEFLFRDLLNQKDQFKVNLEELVKKVQMLNNEVISLKKQNVILKQRNDNLRSIITHQLKTFLKQSVSDKETERMILETLQTVTDDEFLSFKNELQKVIITPNSELKLEDIEANTEENSPRLKQDEVFKKEIDSIYEFNSSKQFLIDNENQENSESKYLPNRYNSEHMLENIFEKKLHSIKSEKDNVSLTYKPKVHNSVSLNFSPNTVRNEKDTSIKQTDISMPETLLNNRKSPVFKDLRNKKQDYVTENEITTSTKSASLKLDENFLLRSGNVTVSPLKRTLGESKSPSPKTKVFTSKRFKLECLDGCFSSKVKKLDSRKVEISCSGIRKLQQTFLNIDYFTNKNIEKNKDECKDLERTIILDEDKRFDGGEDDDFIIESPKKSIQCQIKKKHGLTQDNFHTPPEASVSHCDETYVSSSLLRNNLLKEEDNVKKIDEDQTPLKRPFRDKNPEPKFIYYDHERKPLRKKVERKQLAGHTCAECNQYYKDVFGNFNDENFKDILNKCSRHRRAFSPRAEDTPPGYWKPYLSATISPTKDFIVEK